MAPGCLRGALELKTWVSRLADLPPLGRSHFATSLPELQYTEITSATSRLLTCYGCWVQPARSNEVHFARCPHCVVTHWSSLRPSVLQKTPSHKALDDDSKMRLKKTIRRGVVLNEQYAGKGTAGLIFGKISRMAHVLGYVGENDTSMGVGVSLDIKPAAQRVGGMAENTYAPCIIRNLKSKRTICDFLANVQWHRLFQSDEDA